MKRIIIILMIIVVLLCFTSCSFSSKKEKLEGSLEAPWTLIDLYEFEGHVVQKIIYNNETKLTYVYNYYWTRQESSGYKECTKFELIIFDEYGNKIENKLI